MLIELINLFFGNRYTLFFITTLSFFCKAILLLVIVRHILKKNTQLFLLICTATFLVNSVLDDAFYIVWIYVRQLLEVKGDIPNLTLFGRLDWMSFIGHHQAFALLLTGLTNERLKNRTMLFIHLLINIIINSGFLYLAIFKYGVSSANPDTLYFEIKLIQAAFIYLPFLFIPLFFRIFKKIQAEELPQILVVQLRYLISFISFYLLLATINNPYSYLAFLAPFFSIHHFAFFALTTLLLTFGMMYVSKSVLGLRFLNLRKDVDSKERFNFLSQFRDILEQLSSAMAVNELSHICQTFFHIAFAVPIGKTRLYLRKIDDDKSKSKDKDKETYFHPDTFELRAKVEQFIAKPENKALIQALASSKIFILDEIDFSHFYENNPDDREILNFLTDINAEIFLPIYERDSISAYIIVERKARPARLFTNKERDEMLVFTNYLSNVINLVRYHDLKSLHKQHKEVTEELYHKHREIGQYRESIRSFARSQKERKFGIVLYKNRRFTFANESAQELIGMDLNTNLGHSLTQACNSIVQKVQEFRAVQYISMRDKNGNKLVISGIPIIDEHTIILSIHYPEIADLVDSSQIRNFEDPSAWDYLLYLETTHSGQLINQLIPGRCETILNFKIKLLATALSKKATLLNLAQEDLLATVELLHSISLRQNLQILKLTGPEQHHEIAIKLFGLSPLMQKDATKSVLEKLDNTGTLFIENIEYLHLETQDNLAQFISLGFFKKFKSEHKVCSNVRIICSSIQDLNALVDQGIFSKELCDVLQFTTLTMPSLGSLSDEEINELVEGYAEQIVVDDTYKNLLTLTEKDKTKLYIDRPASLSELKEKVHNLLLQKSSRQQVPEICTFDPAYNVADPDVAYAVRLGKKALKDPQVMAMLWNKFKNQNKIATLLGVNRSSVNRRCQEYNLK